MAADADVEPVSFSEQDASRHAVMLTVYVVADFNPVSVALMLDDVAAAETCVL